eukprot:CAMPEP_0173277962 /NCGR_PEP_ID=MMETSP1143-20121109/4364_1 /TAXON_ID=483371 /ORGANISM="non described non described, Strain CCMP2298" /LENGTH=140 /DNA_ID=CAMNT_0014215097 /DNA_START=78 /DNA_END=497 /DNA_ORIENTATION=-
MSSYQAAGYAEVYSDRDMSDTETGAMSNQFSKSMSALPSHRRPRVLSDLLTDEDRDLDLGLDDVHSYSADEFSKEHHRDMRDKARTGRQRKRMAARTVRGSEFRQHRKKRRVYFCCLSSDIDLPKMLDYVLDGGELFAGW